MFSITLFCLTIFIASLFISLWKEGFTFVATVLLLMTELNPIVSLLIGIAFYCCLFLGEKIKNEYFD